MRSIFAACLLCLIAIPSMASAQSRVVVPAPPPVTTPIARPVPAGTVITATAETDTEIRQREALSRIEAASRSGLIDVRESAHLTRAMSRLQAYQERAYADGVLTLREQARLARLHARIDRAITRAIAR